MCKSILQPSVLVVVNGKDETGAKEMGPIADEFEYLFSECVEQALTDLLGAKVREALLDYLVRHDRLSRGNIPGHPRELTMLLDKTFGKSSITIERYIIRKLYATLKWEYEGTSNFNFDFKLQLEEARTRWKRSHHAIV